MVASTPEEAHKRLLVAMSSNSLGLLPGSLSGRVIVEECWRSQYQPGVPPTGGFGLIARDGRALVIVHLTLGIDKGKRGNAIQRRLTAGDLSLVEVHTIKALSKLAKMGYTSGGPVVRASRAARRTRKR